MSKKTIFVEGLTIAIEQVKEADYISLTDIAKKSTTSEARFLIMSWMKNSGTLEYLAAWELVHNPNFKGDQMVTFKDRYLQNRNVLTPQRWVEATGAIGIVSRSGRSGGTWAHSDIALNFCYWLSPPFQVYFIKEFQRMKEAEFSAKNLEWHVERITNLVDETRNWLDTIPGQKADRDRLNAPQKPAE